MHLRFRQRRIDQPSAVMYIDDIRQCGPASRNIYLYFRKGTEIVANAIADSEAFSIAGGGDTLAAIDLFGIADKISYISTGGGAFLEFVEGKVLPAVAMLEERAKQ